MSPREGGKADHLWMISRIGAQRIFEVCGVCGALRGPLTGQKHVNSRVGERRTELLSEAVGARTRRSAQHEGPLHIDRNATA